MSDLFSAAWMSDFQQQWNDDVELSTSLADIGFSSVIGYGFPEDEQPTGVINVDNGKVVAAGAYNGEALNWDLRAGDEQWRKWMANPPGMMGLGGAFAAGKIKFRVGDYKAMLKDPRMAGPFIKTFSVMGRV